MQIKYIKFSAIVAFIVLLTSFVSAQSGNKYKISAIGFYNLENLFDTIDAPDIRDTEFTPHGSKLWNSKKYNEKLHNMAKVISLMATDKAKDGVAILGVSEIENRTVLEDLVKQPALAKRRYGIIHFDSNDRRGIDLAILYQPKYFTPTDAKPIPVNIFSGTTKIFTRDILFVSGLFDGEKIHILVNHWPSRRGGESKTAPWRAAAALECKKITDSLTASDPMAKVIIMGDLNDDPTSPSVKKVLHAKGKKKKVKEGDIFNPMTQFYRRGIGTTAYRDAWSLFDQIMLTYGWLPKDQDGLRFYKAKIFNKNFLVQKKGHFKGYPMRTFAGNEFLHGYSDHFPVFIYVVKKK
jgi:hypothetical protein